MSPDTPPQKNVIHYYIWGNLPKWRNILRKIEVTETIFYCNSLSYLYNSDTSQRL